MSDQVASPRVRAVQNLETGGWYTDLFFTFEGRDYGTRLPYPAGPAEIARETQQFAQRRMKERAS